MRTSETWRQSTWNVFLFDSSHVLKILSKVYNLQILKLQNCGLISCLVTFCHGFFNIGNKCESLHFGDRNNSLIGLSVKSWHELDLLTDCTFCLWLILIHRMGFCRICENLIAYLCSSTENRVTC